MSYDIDLIDPADDSNRYEVGNYTSNTSPMWRHAFAQSGAPNTGLADLNGLPAQAAADLLAPAIAHMATHPEQYEAMEPSNGWGDYEGALVFMVRFLQQCRYHPGFTVWMSY
jgi:hypothetical protein